MKTLKLTLLALTVVVAGAYAATKAWQIDKAHSTVGFTVDHMKISEVSGEFEEYEGTIKTEGDNFENAEISMTIDVNSINTDNEKRDQHLKSEDFFHAEEHPEITFESTKLEKSGDKEYRLIGKLTMRGKTQKETFKAVHNGTVKDPFSEMIVSGWKISGKVNRYDYGLKWDNTTEAGNLIVGKEVKINCDVELKSEPS